MEKILFMNIGSFEIILLFVLVGLPIILLVYSLFDITRSTFKDPINKVIWAIIAVFVPVFGPILYLTFGKAQKQLP